MKKQTVGKKECAAELGWHRMVLDRRLNRDRNFPVHYDESGRASFVMSEVLAYLEGRAQLVTDDQQMFKNALNTPDNGEIVLITEVHDRLVALVDSVNRDLNGLPERLQKDRCLAEGAEPVAREVIQRICDKLLADATVAFAWKATN